jgi:nucleotide-binding universal stress UspA family protein
MHRDRRTNRIRHYGRPPPGTASDRWVGYSEGDPRPPARIYHPPEEARFAAETEEAGLTLEPPARYRSLLVPLDGEGFGEHALPFALGIARRAEAAVRLVHVHWPPLSAYRSETLAYALRADAWLQRQPQAYLDDLSRRLAKATGVPVTPVFLQGPDIAEALCEVAAAGTDLVVMATHGRGPLGRLWYGSVADVLRRRLSVPLLLVRGHDAPADLTSDPVVRHVLIPLDGSETAEQALEPALTLGTLTGADHTLLRAVPLRPDYSVGYGRLAQKLAGGRRRTEAAGYVRQVAERLGGRTNRVHPRVMHDERPVARAILEYAREHDVDLIALASRGRRGLARLFRSSVADRVVRGANVPVLVIRADGEQGG